MNFKLRTINNEQGFILALSVLLVLVLGISGTAFMQLDFQERRMAMNEVDNHGGFYLANAGIERGREVLKIDTGGIPSWTPVLTALPDDTNRINNPLCPTDPTWKCLILPFGTPVLSPDIPFGGTFDNGQYEVRAFNDGYPPNPSIPGETSTGDTDGILVLRARGTIQSEAKLIEMTVKASSGSNLITCAVTPCPDEACNPITHPQCVSLDGHEPGVVPEIASLNFPLSDSNNYYRFDQVPTNFTKYSLGPALGVFTCDNLDLTHRIDCTDPGHINLDVVNDSFYFVNSADSKVKINSTGIGPAGNRSRVVVYVLGGNNGQVIMEGNHEYTAMIIIGQGLLEIKDGTIRAPLPMPAVIVEGNVHLGNASIQVFGNVYATGEVDLNPLAVEGVTMANNVEIQGGNIYTDNGNLTYYAIMPGFHYPNDLLTTVSVGPGSWKEIE